MSNQGHGEKMTVVLFNSVCDMKFFLMIDKVRLHSLFACIYLYQKCM